MIGPETTISLAGLYRMQWEEAQQCHVLLFPEGMIQLNGPAAEILSRCAQPRDVASLLLELQQAFPDAPDLTADVYEFLAVAQDKGWIDLG